MAQLSSKSKELNFDKCKTQRKEQKNKNVSFDCIGKTIDCDIGIDLVHT